MQLHRHRRHRPQALPERLSSAPTAPSTPAPTASPIAPSTPTGNFVDNHQVWTIHSVAYDNTIQSGRSALVRYQFHLPANATGPFTLAPRSSTATSARPT